MNRKIKERWKIIEAHNAEEWERIYEEVTEDMEIVSEEWNTQRGTHCLYVRYKRRIEKPVTVEDEYELKGERYHCAECPYFEPPLDFRAKRCGCKLRGYTYKDTYACEPFYRQLKAGRFTVGPQGTFVEVEQ